MYMISREEMPPKLEKAWAFLSGIHLTFTERDAHHHNIPSTHNLTVILPVILDDISKARAMAIGLTIDEAEANRVASFMFGVCLEELTQNDIKDACKESCNVLGGGLVDTSNSKLGIPEEITTENFQRLQDASEFNLTFASDAPFDNRIVLTIFDVTNNNIGGTN